MNGDHREGTAFLGEMEEGGGPETIGPWERKEDKKKDAIVS